jgi:hypothetical protein
MTTTKVEFDPFSDEYFNDPTEVYGAGATSRPSTTARGARF